MRRFWDAPRALIPQTLMSKTLNPKADGGPVQALMNSLRAGIIAARVGAVVDLFPGIYVAPLMMGTLAASGGKLCVDAIMQLFGPKPSGALRYALLGPGACRSATQNVGRLHKERCCITWVRLALGSCRV